MLDLPRVSVVIVTWNALPLLQQCLPSVVATDYPNLEIIVADNASEDGSAAWIEATYPDEVQVVRHPENWAFAEGNNAALPHATGEFVVLLNNDVEVPPGWLRPLVDDVLAHDDVAAVQPKLLLHGDRSRFEYAGGAGGFLDRVGYPFTRGRLFFSLEEDRGQYDDARDVFWATGAALLLRREAIDSVSRPGQAPLDERFVMHMEEIDLCWRLHRAGWRVRCVPESEVYHIGGGSLPQGNPHKAYLNFRNGLLMLYKNLPPRVWRTTFPQRAALDAAAAARALASGNAAEAAAIARAYADAHRLKHHYDDQRPSGVEPAVLPPYRGYLAIDYFLRGRRTFADLPVGSFELE